MLLAEASWDFWMRPQLNGGRVVGRKSNMWREALVSIVMANSGCVGADDSTDSNASSGAASMPPASCMRLCVDDNDGCSLTAPDDVPPLDETQSDWETDCGAERPFLVRGACEDGGQFLVYSTGHSGERRVYDRQGEFSALVAFTDTGAEPCYGQGYWPAFPECESPMVTETLCGASDLTGEPVPIWVEP